MLKRGKAPGIDGRTMESYTEEEIKTRLMETVALLKGKRYHPKPLRRVYIESGSRKERPLGIPAVIDKVVQLGITRILEPIYEPLFMPVSYGYRKNRNAHEALKEINHMIMGRRVNWIIEADIKSFFDSINHQWLMRMVKERITDSSLLLIIYRFIRSGIMEEGNYKKTTEGTPQGGVLSPILANIYLHYVLDLWFEMKLKQTLQGYAQLIRYADDFIIGTQHKYEAERIIDKLHERFLKFGLSLSKEKTRILEFGRFAEENTRRRGENKPETFNFVGFTHYCDKTRDGRFAVKVKTERKRQNKALTAFNQWIKSIRNRKTTESIWQLIASKLTGHYNYYGVSGNFESIKHYYSRVRNLTFKWLNRRSRKKSWNWEGFIRYNSLYPLPRPKLTYAFYNTW
jgi:group II intron reverse transcriptase/maturase